MEEKQITISTATLVRILAFIVGTYLFYVMWDIILLLFVAVIFSTLIDPLASWFQSKKIPRALAVIVIYAVIAAIAAAMLVLLVPVMANDVPVLVQQLGDTWEGVRDSQWYVDGLAGVQAVQRSLGISSGGDGGVSSQDVGSTISGVFTTISGFFGGMLSLILVLVITFYLVVQEDPVQKILTGLLPEAQVPYAVSLLKRIRDKLGYWVRGQLFLSVTIGVLVWVAMAIIGVRHAAALGLVAALLEFVPYIGPTMAAFPGVFLGFTQGGIVTATIVVGAYFLIQWCENNILVPKVMQRAVGLNPVVSIVAILTGIKLAGVVGALLAIPVATATSVVLYDFFSHKE